MNRPWFKFYPRDWRADEKLRACSLAARGLWVEMMAVAHVAEPYGYLVINGKPLEAPQIAAQAGAPLAEVLPLLAELETNGVYSKNKAGAIYSRRMVKDNQRRIDGENAQKKQRSRVNETAENNAENQPPKGSPQGEPLTQKPEARAQKEEKKLASLAAREPVAPVEMISPTKAKRLSRLPEGWQPRAEDWQAATDAGLDVEAEVARFRDHHLAKGSTFEDWHAAFRTWCGRAPEFNARGGNGDRGRSKTLSALDRLSTGRDSKIKAALDRVVLP